MTVSTDAVLFDLDGCLVDSRVPFARSVNHALREHDLPVQDEFELHGYLGPPIHHTFQTLTGADDELAWSLVEAYRARYRAHMVDETPVFDGIPEVLATLSAEVPLVVATSKARTLAEPLIDALGLGQYFHAVVGSAPEAPDEPKTETVRKALAQVPEARAAAMVGDRRFDMEAAREHGLHGVGVLWGIGSETELREAGAATLVREPAQLLAELTARR